MHRRKKNDFSPAHAGREEIDDDFAIAYFFSKQNIPESYYWIWSAKDLNDYAGYVMRIESRKSYADGENGDTENVELGGIDEKTGRE